MPEFPDIDAVHGRDKLTPNQLDFQKFADRSSASTEAEYEDVINGNCASLSKHSRFNLGFTRYRSFGPEVSSKSRYRLTASTYSGLAGPTAEGTAFDPSRPSGAGNVRGSPCSGVANVVGNDAS